MKIFSNGTSILVKKKSPIETDDEEQEAETPCHFLGVHWPVYPVRKIAVSPLETAMLSHSLVSKSHASSNTLPSLDASDSSAASDRSGDSQTRTITNTTRHDVTEKPPALTRAVVDDTPPFHARALIVFLIGFFVQRLPSWHSLDAIATVDTFTHVNFDSLPLDVVIGFRLSMAVIMLGNASHVFLFGKWEADTDYVPASRLQVAKKIAFRGALHLEGSLLSGLQCVSTFTLWCWMIEGTAFLLAGMIPLVHIYFPATTISPWILRTAMILWETAAPVSILVSAVVKYALWPMAMEQGENIKLLKAPGALFQHNLNSVAALVEVGLMGGLPVCTGHFAFPVLYGILYLLFAYSLMYSWADRSKGAQFFYPFFDTTLGVMTSLAIVALLAILSLSFGIFCAAAHVLAHAEDYVALVPFAAIVLLSQSVCRVRD